MVIRSPVVVLFVGSRYQNEANQQQPTVFQAMVLYTEVSYWALRQLLIEHVLIIPAGLVTYHS